LTAADVKALTRRAGHTRFDACSRTQTVDEYLGQPPTKGFHMATGSSGFFWFGRGTIQAVIEAGNHFALACLS